MYNCNVYPKGPYDRSRSYCVRLSDLPSDSLCPYVFFFLMLFLLIEFVCWYVIFTQRSVYLHFPMFLYPYYAKFTPLVLFCHCLAARSLAYASVVAEEYFWVRPSDLCRLSKWSPGSQCYDGDQPFGRHKVSSG